MNYIELFQKDLSTYNDRLAIIDLAMKKQISYRELDEASSKVADKLHKLGIKKHSYIIINLDRCINYIIAYFGVLKAGMAVVPCSTAYPKDRIDYIANDCNAKLIIEDEFFSDLDKYEKYSDLAIDDEPCLLVYTSGSTGNPKGVLHGVKGIANAVIQKQALFKDIDKIIFPSCVMITFAVHILEYLTTLSLRGTVYIVDDETRKDVKKLEKFYKDNEITIGQISPQMLKLFDVKGMKKLKRIVTGSERVVDTYFKDVEILNMYGCTESCGSITGFKVDRSYENTPIGKPIEGIEIKILDDNGNEVEKGTEGEICAIGDFSVSYFKDPVLSSKKFIKLDDGKILLHTGDLGYFDENDNLIFVNRKDWMLKINGNRVEPGEIEQVLRKYKNIKQAVVKGFVNLSGQTYLCAYYVSDKEIKNENLKTFLKKDLPEYMIPSFFIRLDKMPINQNGKIDRLSLKAVDPSQFHAPFEAPINETEEKICKAFEEVLKCGKVGRNDDFYFLGGNSISTLQMIYASGLNHLTPVIVYDNKTPAKISEAIDFGDFYENTNIEKGSYDLTDSQMGVYLECVANPNTLKYNIPITYVAEKDKSISAQLFSDCLAKAINNHRLLRFTVMTLEGRPQLVDSNEMINVPIFSLNDDEVSDFINNFVTSFNYDGGLLTRACIIDTPSKIYIQIDIHHLIYDGTSNKILFEDFVNAYLGKELVKEELTLLNQSIREKNIDIERKRISSEYFINKFAGLEIDSNLASDNVDKKYTSGVSLLQIELFNDNNEVLSSLIKDHGFNYSAYFLAAFAYTLSKFINRNDVYFHTVNNGRQDSRFSHSVGMFVRTMPLLCKIDENSSVYEFIQKVQDEYYDVLKNDCFNYADIASKIDASTNISFVYHDDISADIVINNKKLEVIRNIKDTQADLTVHVFKDNNIYRCDVEYKEYLFSNNLINSFCEIFSLVINSFVYDIQLSEINILSNNQIEILNSFNQSEVTYDKNKTILQLFKEQVSLHSNNNCLVYKNHIYTYNEVDQITNRLAKFLISRGSKKNDVVGVLINRSEYILLCSLAILKAGCAYLPLDPSYPKERINYMISDSSAKIIITDIDLCGMIDEFLNHDIILTQDILGLQDSELNLPTVSLDNNFVVLYTSGSTGKPKGVIYNHLNALIISLWVQKEVGLTSADNSAEYPSYGFDAHIIDTYSSIISGSCLHIIPDEIRLDLLELQKYFNDNSIVQATFTTQIGRQFILLEGNSSLRHLILGGEKLSSVVPKDNIIVHNAYGPTEGSVMVTHFIVDKNYNDIPIGKVIDNVKAYVVDSKCRRLPIGAEGELLIAGPHITQGYLNQEEKTKEVFIDNPFDGGEYSRAYRTGDIVRYIDGGNLQFIGRRDMQVKIRGFRIELSEIEEVIGRYPGVKNVAVTAFDNPSGGKYLAAYVESDIEFDEKRIKEYVSKEKPPYMVPTYIVKIDKIPLTQNFKVNKKALPLPQITPQNDIAPQNDNQKRIFDILTRIIGHNNFGVDTDLFDAGLSSIGCVNLNVELSMAFNKTIKISDINKHCTIRSLEEFLKNDSDEVKKEIHSDYPLTSSQFGVFYESKSNSNSLNYNVPVLYKINENTDVDSVKKALKMLADAHPCLKTTLFVNENGDIRAKRNDNASLNIEEIEIDEIEKIEDIVKPFNLLRNNLYRFIIYKTRTGNYLFMDIHHIINDGTSETIIFKDLQSALEGNKLIPEDYTGFELALEEENIKKTEDYKKAKDYYTSLLSGRDNSFRINKAPENNIKESISFEYTFNFDYSKVKMYCEKNDYSMNALFNSAISLVLSRFINNENVNYATVYSGRNDSRLQNAVMMLVKTVPMSYVINEETRIDDFIHSTQKQIINNMRNDSYCFAEISSDFGFESDVMFSFEGENFGKNSVSNDFLTIHDTMDAYAKYPITLVIKVVDNKFVINASYLTKSFNECLVRSICESIESAVNEFFVKKLLKDVSILSTYYSSFIEENNSTYAHFINQPFSKLFESCATVGANKPCIITSLESKTYDDVNKEANIIANSLIDLGVSKDNIIGIILDRNSEFLISQIAINKAGGAFLSILPSYPDDRIEYCLVNADAPYVITTSTIYESRKSLFDNKPYKVLFIEDLLSNTNVENPNVDIDPHSLAYCIYTSGSTGTPKGVLIENHSLSNFIQTSDIAKSIYNSDPLNDVGICVASFSFDISILETMILLSIGKAVVLANDDEIHNPLALSNLIINNNVSIMACTPTFISNMIDIDEFVEAFKNLKALMLGAEAFPKGLYEKITKISKDIILMNGYGPTETTIGCSSKLLDSGENITIGKPFGNTKMFVVDKYNHIQPPYANGELIICGEGVGRGYIKLPEKTAKSFFKFNNINAYRSGDIVRLDKNGEYEFFGRNDNQVKIRGFRIELDEIEKTACSLDGIKQCKVIVRNNGHEDYLAMFFTAETSIDLNVLKKLLSSKLTYYMVPQAIKQLDKMPLNNSGKIDKNALPEVVVDKRSSNKRKAKLSSEQLVAELFKNALEINDIYMDDNFFELGGTSISASKVVMSLMSENIEINYQDIFEHPTVESLAMFIDSIKKKESSLTTTNSGEDVNEFKDALKYNNLNYANSITRDSLKNVFLSGATGFLGIHVLADLLANEKGHIYCLVRKGKYISPKDRLLKLLMYYFDKDYEDIIHDRVTIIDADITDDNLISKFDKYSFNTIINCSACVKHYAADDVLERINVHGVENLIDLALNKNAKMIQISTTSIPGMHTKDSYEKRIRMYEDQMFMFDSMNNKYLLSKYHAEQKMFTAIEKKGLRGKVIRVGNLMGRYEDGEFQFNMNTNAFLNGVRGFATLGMCPISHTTDPVSFAPIDLTARAVVLLAGTDDKFTAFNADSRYSFDEFQLIRACNRCGIPIRFIEDEDYYREYKLKLADEKINSRLTGLMTNDIQNVHPIETDNKFTTYVLYRLGFAWPFVDDNYLDKAINSIKTLGFFDYEE